MAPSDYEDSAVVGLLLESVTALWSRLPADAHVAIGVLVESLVRESGYEQVGEDGKRLLVTCNQELKELSETDFAQIAWPPGHELEDLP